MLQRKESFVSRKLLLIFSVIAVSMAACSSSGPESTSNSNDSASSTSATPTSSSSPQATASSDTVATLNTSEVQFKAASKNTIVGYFDGINGSGEAKIEVSKTTPVIARGWAVIPGENRPADSVIITYGEDNTVVAVAPVNQPRPDVARYLKSSANPNFGWSATLDSSTLSNGPVTLKAWAYNSATKEAIQLNLLHQVAISG